MSAPALSIVTSMYQSARFLPDFHSRCTAAARALSGAYEIILVNDGSPDESLRVALDLHERDPHVRVIDLSRNFGHQKALMTGLAHACGQLIFLIDCDLEEDPEWLSRFHDTMITSGADVVYGVQEARKGGWIERTAVHMLWSAFNRMLTHPIPVNAVTARLMTSRYVTALVSHQERSCAWPACGPSPASSSIRSGSARATATSPATRYASGSRRSPTRSPRSATAPWSTSSGSESR